MRTRVVVVSLISIVAVAFICLYVFLGSVIKTSATSNVSNSRVAVKNLAQHLTTKEHEQREVVKFVSNMEDVFHINPYIVFMNSDYLVVTYTDSKRYGFKIKFYFTDSEPLTDTEERDGETTNWVRVNGYISYAYHGRTDYRNAYFKSWYENPAKEGSWSGGFGYNPDEEAIGWVKVVNLKTFHWQQW